MCISLASRPEFARSPGSGAAPGADVAVKVRHPRVLWETFVDVDIIFWIIDKLGIGALPTTKRDFADLLQQQIDLSVEATNLARFRRNFREELDAGRVLFPEVVARLHAPTVLVENWIEGRTVDGLFSGVGEGFAKARGETLSYASKQVQKESGPMPSPAAAAAAPKPLVAGKELDEAKQAQRQQLARDIWDLNMKMFLRDNLAHGDLHAGNILYREGRRCVSVLDVGLTSSLNTTELKAAFEGFVAAMCTADVGQMHDCLLQFQDTRHCARACNVGLHEDIAATMARWVGEGGRGPDGGPISFGDIMGELLYKMCDRGIVLQGCVAATIAGMTVSEGVIRSLDPEFDMARESVPYFLKCVCARSRQPLLGLPSTFQQRPPTNPPLPAQVLAWGLSSEAGGADSPMTVHVINLWLHHRLPAELWLLPGRRYGEEGTAGRLSSRFASMLSGAAAV